MGALIKLNLPVDEVNVSVNTATLSASFDSIYDDDLSTGKFTDALYSNGIILDTSISVDNTLNVTWGVNSAGHPGSTIDMDNTIATATGLTSNTIKTDVGWGLSISNLKPSYLPEDNYVFKIEGYIYCPIAGNYIFAIDSDDCSDLFIDNTFVVGRYNSSGMGVSNNWNSQATVSLTAGWHSILGRMEEISGGDGFGIAWQKPNDSSISLIQPAYFSTIVPTYLTSGSRVTSIVLNGTASNMTITWDSVTPTNTAVVVKTVITSDGENSPADVGYAVMTSGDLVVADDSILDNKFLWVKIELSTTDITATPFITNLTVNIPNDILGSIIFEIDRVSTFNSPLLQTTTVTGLSRNEITEWTPTNRFIGSVWYWRAKSSNSGETSEYSEVRVLNVKAALYKRALYQYENIAKYGPCWNNKRAIYQYENIAKYGPYWTNKRAIYEYENITDDPPFPYIENLNSTRGAVGSIITITGSGFGAKYESDAENEDRSLRGYGGYVYINDLTCNILSWSWTEITFQIPADAESGAIKVQLLVPNSRDSNLIGFEVYEGVHADDIGVELFICDKTSPNTVLCQLDGAKNKAFQVLLNNPGSGGFSISRYDKNGGNREYISDQNFVLCKVDGIDVFKWIIESRKPNYIDLGEQQMIEVSGRGVLGMLNWAVVYPENMGVPVLERNFTGKASAILRTLLLEAQARGCLKGVSIDWTADADSIGNPFLDLTTISFHVGTPLLEVAKKFTEGMGLFDIEMTPELKLRIYKVKGEDKYATVKYRPGQAILSHQNQSDATNVVNEVLLEGSDGILAIADHPTSQAEWGRREGYLQASNIKDGLSEYGQMYLNKSAYANWGIQGTVTKFVDTDGNKIKPFETFLNGDWIGWFIPPEGTDTTGFDGKLRVKGITVQEDDDTGNLSYTLELNNIMLETEIKMAQSVERLARYSGNDALSNPSTVTPAPLDHTHAHSLLTGLDADDHPQYFNEERHAADSHNSIQRVSSFRSSGGNALTGDVSLVAGSNVVITQNDEAKSITIAAIGGSSGGGTVYSRAIDIPPAYPSMMDDEFDGTVLDSKWTVLSKLSNETVTVENGSLILEVPTGGTNHRRLAVVQSTPSSNWKVRAKCASEGLSWNYFGIFLLARRITDGIDKNVYCGLMAHSSYGFWTGYAGTMNTESLVSEVDLCNYAGSEFYLELEYDGTNLIWRISTTGVRFRHMWTQAVTTFLGGAPDQVGIMIHPYDNTGSGWSGLGTFDWFRCIT